MKREWIFEETAVEGYAGYKGEEAPRSFFYGGRRIEVLEILDRWYEGGVDPAGIPHDYFKVKTAEEAVFLLRHTPRFRAWTVCRRAPESQDADN